MKWVGLFLLLLAVGGSYGLFHYEKNLILKEDVTSWTRDSKADCAVVLTGKAYRVQEGLDLLARNSVRKVIISGVNPNSKLEEIYPQMPFLSSLNPDDIILERNSLTTYGNASQSLQLVEALNCRDILLVTSRLHMYRAYRTFRHTFPEAIEIDKHSVVSGHLRPSIGEIASEVIKSLFYEVLLRFV